MKIYLKGYALGVLLGLLFFLPAFNPALQINWTVHDHWIAMLIFTPALLYFILSFGEFNAISFKKESIKKSCSFILGTVLTIYALYCIWGLPM